MSSECVFACVSMHACVPAVLDETYSGEHKVKITSAVISEESHKSTDIGGQLIPQNSADNFNARR